MYLHFLQTIILTSHQKKKKKQNQYSGADVSARCPFQRASVEMCSLLVFHFGARPMGIIWRHATPEIHRTCISHVSPTAVENKHGHLSVSPSEDGRRCDGPLHKCIQDIWCTFSENKVLAYIAWHTRTNSRSHPSHPIQSTPAPPSPASAWGHLTQHKESAIQGKELLDLLQFPVSGEKLHYLLWGGQHLGNGLWKSQRAFSLEGLVTAGECSVHFVTPRDTLL